LIFIPVASLPEAQLLSWGWRIPFLLSFVVLVVAYLIRRTMPETPAFSEIKEKHELARFPVLALLRDYRGDVLRVIVCALIAPVISQSLLGDGPNGWIPVAIFVAGCCVVSAAAAATARETHAVSIEDLGRKVQEA